MQIQQDKKQRFLSYLQEALTASLIDEVSATPKPGLVDLRDSGAHRDMDFHTFFASTRAIVPYLVSMADLGISWEERDHLHALFSAVRPIGMEAEKAMFEATDGVNTHKGMIFSMGLAAVAAGYVFAGSCAVSISAAAVLSLCGAMCRLPLEADFAAISPLSPKTHGERLYVTHGIRGIRGEAADGFPAIREHSLPLLRKEIVQHPGGDWNLICLQTLLKLMAEVDDTNVLFRADYAALLYVRKQAAFLLSLGGSFSERGMAGLVKLNEDFIKRNVSPGGCADLLAITLFLWRLEQFSLTD